MNQSGNLKLTVHRDLVSSSITTSFTELFAATAMANVNSIEIENTSGQSFRLGLGGSGSEEDYMVVFIGGNTRQSINITTDLRLSIKTFAGTANTGELNINLWG